ncbi:MAG: GNAT family N-acetyltransferase [Clostridia bacterium]|nr:GNAT family N-acetyltransferase [Clostridia bacterium]
MDACICRMAKEEDREALLSLWQICFTEDTPADIRAFLSLTDITQQACCAFVGDTLVSMLFLLPAVAVHEQTEYPVHYLYAGCTHPSHRGRRYYGFLLNFAVQQTQKQQNHAIYLHPAEDKLFDYYAGFGYRRGIQPLPLVLPKNAVVLGPQEPFFSYFGVGIEGECMWIPVTETALTKAMGHCPAFASRLGN